MIGRSSHFDRAPQRTEDIAVNATFQRSSADFSNLIFMPMIEDQMQIAQQLLAYEYRRLTCIDQALMSRFR
jgi:hypothetical protein